MKRLIRTLTPVITLFLLLLIQIEANEPNSTVSEGEEWVSCTIVEVGEA